MCKSKNRLFRLEESVPLATAATGGGEGAAEGPDALPRA